MISISLPGGINNMIRPAIIKTNKIQPMIPLNMVKSILVWNAKIVRKKTMRAVMPAAMITDSVS